MSSLFGLWHPAGITQWNVTFSTNGMAGWKGPSTAFCCCTMHQRKNGSSSCCAAITFFFVVLCCVSKYAFVLFLTFVSLYVMLPLTHLIVYALSFVILICLSVFFLDVCDVFHLFLSQPYGMRDMFVFQHRYTTNCRLNGHVLVNFWVTREHCHFPVLLRLSVCKI